MQTNKIILHPVLAIQLGNSQTKFPEHNKTRIIHKIIPRFSISKLNR
jgi:hypothetical protein